jgi:hypothetical protein
MLCQRHRQFDLPQSLPLGAACKTFSSWSRCPSNREYHTERQSRPIRISENADQFAFLQPVGFSKASADPEHHVKTLEAATEDFVDFTRQFVTDVFPQLSTNELHIAGESYGGRWAPAVMHALASLADVRSARAVPNPLGSIILVNAVIGTLGGQLATANYEFGCTPDGVATKLGLGYNSSVCSIIQELGPECEYYGTLCESTNSITVCKDASAFCEGKIASLTRIPSRSMYNSKNTLFPSFESSLLALGSQYSNEWRSGDYGRSKLIFVICF